MSEQQNHPEVDQKQLAAKNTRLAIILGLVAFGFYAGFILMYAT